MNRALVATRPGVLMVTGAYHPEVSGAGLQCRALIRALGDRADCGVLTTSAVEGPARTEVDGVTVHRVFVRPGDPGSEARAMLGLLRGFLRLGRGRPIVHFHGFSRKSVALMLLARAFGKRRVVKLTSVGHDDPLAMRAGGGLTAWAYGQADLYIGVSPRLGELCAAAGVAGDRFRLIANGVALDRFRVAGPDERQALRRELALPEAGPVVLFVGFFSRDKRPDVLFEAWRRSGMTERSTLVFVGATRSPYYEVDATLAGKIRAEAGAFRGRVVFVERSDAIEKYFRAADVFVLPSAREGLPNALLEAMATGLACIASRLPGVTDTIVEDGVTGRLVPPGDAGALAVVLAELLVNADARARMGLAARRAVTARYSIEASAQAHLDAYRALNRLGGGPPSALV